MVASFDISVLSNRRFRYTSHPPTVNVSWIRHPQCLSEKPDGMSVQNYECLTDVTSDTSLKHKFSELPVVEFCCSFLQEYPQVSECAAPRFLPFPTTRLYEAAFSMYAKNLNIVTEWMWHPIREFSCLHSFPS